MLNSNNKYENSYKSFLYIIAIVILIVAITLNIYNSYVKTKLSETSCNTLEEIMLQQAYSFTLDLEGELSAMSAIAELYPFLPDTGESSVDMLKKLIQKTSFESISVVNTAGEGFSSNGKSINVSDRNYFKNVMVGEVVISEPVQSKVEGEGIVVLIAAPIKRNGNIVGALIGSYDKSKLERLFTTSFNGEGYAFVADNEGDIIACTPNAKRITTVDNIYESLKMAKKYEKDSYETILKNIFVGKSGHSSFELLGQRFLMHYSPIKTNNWYIFSIVPEVYATKTLKDITVGTILLTICYTLVVLALVYKFYLSQREHIHELSHIAYIDPVTGYSNFNKFKNDAKELLKKNESKNYAMVKLDVDRFKLVNELYGHIDGDNVLKFIAQALDSVTDKKYETFGRVVADEFVVLLIYNDVSELRMKRKAFESMFSELSTKILSSKLEFPTGRYRIGKNETDVVEIYEKVNFAHKLSKNSDKSVFDYDDNVRELAVREKDIENKMEHALLNKEFKLYLQAKYFLKGETIAGAEALVRWHNEELETIYPSIFIPLFEHNGFIKKLDMYMFEEVCKTVRHWIDTGIKPITVSVNFSRLHLTKETFVSELCYIADKYSVPRHFLEIELTETVMLDNEDILADVLERIHNAGFTLSMDDFGTGYSSLGLLKNIPVDVIKIDRSFFSITRDVKRAKTVISNVLCMAKELDILTVAEGVETRDHIELLRELGCDIVQGYYYAKPIQEAEFTHMFKNMGEIRTHHFSRYHKY